MSFVERCLEFFVMRSRIQCVKEKLTKVFTRFAAQEKIERRFKDHHLNQMKRLAVSWRGKIEKKRADGLEVYFKNTIDAVGWALDIQNRISTGHHHIPLEERMQHRMGIHLEGRKGKIAEELQLKAKSGGICISQSIYDEVKKRMNIQVKFLGEYQLKGSKKTTGVYQLPLNSRDNSEDEDLPKELLKRKILWGRVWFWIILLALAAALVPVGIWFWQKYKSEHEALSFPTSAEVFLENESLNQKGQLPEEQGGAGAEEQAQPLPQE